jgi:hypothetical protein
MMAQKDSKDIFDLFIIHVSRDARVALELALELERAGYRTWCYELDSHPAVPSYVDNILRGIEDAQVLLALVSPRSLQKPEQVTAEINYGRAGKKTLVPLLLDLTDAEFEDRLPEMWRDAFGLAPRVRVDPRRVYKATERIARGLQDSGRTPRQADDSRSRVDMLRNEIELLEKLGDEPPTAPPPPSPDGGEEGRSIRGRFGRWLREHPDALRWSAGAAALVIVVVMVGRELWPVICEPLGYCELRNVWIQDASPEESVPSKEYRQVHEQMEGALLMIVAAASVETKVFNDREIVDEVVAAGCNDRDRFNKESACSEAIALGRLRIGAKVTPTLHAEGDTRSLELRIGPGKGAASKPQSESLRDANLTSLADWAAEQIARFIHIPPEQIARALERRKQHSQRLEDTLAGGAPTSPSDSSGTTRLLGSWISVASAQEIPAKSGEREILEVLGRLRSALQTMKAGEVAPLYASMTPEQRAALQRYFDNLDNLQVTFSDTDITVQGDTARAAFLREDKFKEKDTGESSSLAIRLVAVLVRSDGNWKIQSLQKPS